MSSEKLEPHEWMHHVAGLGVPGRKRVPHDCGEGEPLLITREHDRCTAYCFRCGATGFNREHESLADKLSRTLREEAAESSVRGSAELPEPREYDTKAWPLRDKVWFFKQGISLAMIGKLGLYWCPKLGRVVLPIMQGDRVVYWTARSSSRAPKWLTPSVPKQGLTARYGVGKGDTIVLTEDPLSAFKVGLVTEAWCLLGTKMHDKTVAALVGSGKRVAVWLDDDRGRSNGKNPGQDAAMKIAARLRAFGIDVRNITSDKDPKNYGEDYIRGRVYPVARLV